MSSSLQKKIENQNILEEKNILNSSDIPSDVVITSATIHILDKGCDEPVLNQTTMELTETIYKYLYKHIEKCLRHNKLRFGKFNPQINSVKDISNMILTGEYNLIEGSERLSKILFQVIKHAENAESCDLITAMLSTDKGPMIAILKLDYVENFIHSVNFEDGKLKIDVSPVQIGLPSSAKKISKAAFIVADSNKNFDLLFLDENKRKKDEEYDSNFWKNSFLNCIELSSANSITSSFLDSMETWTRALNDTDVSETERVRRTVRELVREEDVVNREELGYILFKNSPERLAELNEFLDNRGFDEEFEVDRVTAVKKLETVKIQIDKDITLSLDTNTYNDQDKFAITKNSDGSINMVIKNIRHYIEK